VKVSECKVILGEACLTHRLVCSDLRVEGMKRNKLKKGEKKIKQHPGREICGETTGRFKWTLARENTHVFFGSIQYRI